MELILENKWFIGIACSLIAGAIIGIISYVKKRRKTQLSSSATSNLRIGRKNKIKGGIHVNTSTNREHDE